MKHAVLAVTAAALAFPVGFAAPASADIFGNTLTVSADNTTGTVPMSVSAQVECGEGLDSNGFALLNDVVPVGETRGEVPSCHLPAGSNGEWSLNLNGVECAGRITNPYVGGLTAGRWNRGYDNCPWPSVIEEGGAEYTPYFRWAKNDDGVYNLTVTPPEVWQTMVAPSQTPPVAAADVNADPSSRRAKEADTGYLTRHPGRVTAMAKRFVNHPGDMVNIHGYGPDRDVALARAEHVRDYLLSEITRLGGEPDTYPVMVTYAGDPDHKKGVHVTIHQHTASLSTVPDVGTLTIGGTS